MVVGGGSGAGGDSSSGSFSAPPSPSFPSSCSFVVGVVSSSLVFSSLGGVVVPM